MKWFASGRSDCGMREWQTVALLIYVMDLLRRILSSDQHRYEVESSSH
eukprot:COSAG02_NODE_5389_length_4373_cov_8.033224_2_plen_48_part_00